MGWFAIVKKFTNIAMFVWKFGIQNLVWTEPRRAVDLRIRSARLEIWNSESGLDGT